MNNLNDNSDNNVLKEKYIEILEKIEEMETFLYKKEDDEYVHIPEPVKESLVKLKQIVAEITTNSKMTFEELKTHNIKLSSTIYDLNNDLNKDIKDMQDISKWQIKKDETHEAFISILFNRTSNLENDILALINNVLNLKDSIDKTSKIINKSGNSTILGIGKYNISFK